MKISSLPRKTFDAVERPVSDAAESIMGTDAFMDALAIAWKVQRRALRRVERTAAAGLHAVGVPTRAELLNELGGLQREVRELRREVEAR